MEPIFVHDDFGGHYVHDGHIQPVDPIIYRQQICERARHILEEDMWRAVLTDALQDPARVQLESTYFLETTILIHQELISMAQDDAMYDDTLFSIIMAAPAPSRSPEPVPILDHFALASPEPATDSDHMDTDSDGDISGSEGSGSNSSTDSDSSDDDNVDDVLIMEDDAEGDDPMGDLQGGEEDDYDPPVLPVVEDEVAPIPEPDHEVPVDVEDEEEDPEEDPIIDLEDAPLVQPDPHDIDLDDEPIEIIDVMDDALLEEADPEDDDDEDVDIDGLDGEEFSP